MMNKQGWNYVPINDVAEVNKSSLKNSTPKDLEFDYIDIASITRTGVIENAKKLTFGEAPSRARRIVHIGDTIISTVRPYLKAFAFINKDYDRQVCSTGFAVLTPKETKVDPKYLYQTILSDKFVEYTKSKMTGSNYPAINAGDVKDYRIYLPPLQEQKKIAEILSSVDEAIERTEEIIEQTEKIKKGLMQQLLTKGIGHTKFKKTVLGMTPEGWEVAALKSIARKVTDGTHQSPKFTEEGIPFLLVSNIVKGFINWETEKFISNETYLELTKNRQVEKGDILYSAVGSYGVAVVVDIERGFSFQRHIAWVKPLVEKVDSHYLAYVLNSGIGKKQADSVAVGNAQKTITLDSLSKFLIPLPSLTEQKEIVDVLWSFDKKLRIENRKLLSLKMIKQGLMQSLLTGKVRVKVDKNEVGQV
ncbi:restriction endonuclease subunit S [Bacillus mycoides]|uniref:restriction endonuclease subunit S n=1 Tax=Bacillus mycoides TaxID=1405 RepID=UPI002E1B1894|nr:restriction endonuclease subunit S [Bacillus mycoides]